MSDGELREMRALLEAVIAAWREGWDCSENPWHEAVEQAVRNAEHALEEADAARTRGAEAVSVRLTAEQSDWLEHQSARADVDVESIVSRCVDAEMYRDVGGGSPSPARPQAKRLPCCGREVGWCVCGI